MNDITIRALDLREGDTVHKGAKLSIRVSEVEVVGKMVNYLGEVLRDERFPNRVGTFQRNAYRTNTALSVTRP